VRFKFDENLSARLAPLLAQEGHEVETVVGERLSGRPDSDIFEICRKESRALITLDLDFANPIRFPPADTEGVVVLRPMRPVLPLIRSLLKSVLPSILSETLHGKLWIVEPARIRVYDPGESDS